MRIGIKKEQPMIQPLKHFYFKRGSKHRKKRLLDIIIEVVLWLLSLTIIYPLAMVLLTSFKSFGEARFLSIALPQQFLIENYFQVFVEGRILRSFMNSSIITVFSVALLVVFSSIISYIIVRRPTTFTRIIHRVLTFGIIAPFAALPTIQLLQFLGIYGTYSSLILFYSALFIPFSSILYCSFIKTVPKELDEAAVIDGCTGFTLFMKVIFPVLQPVTITVGVLNFMWVWNDFFHPLFLTNTSRMWTLPLSVYSFFGQFNRSWHLVCANMVLVSLPVIIIYLCAQKYIISGMTAGAVKG